MARRSDVPKRSEVTEKVEQHQSDMHDKAEEMDPVVSDVETVRQTLEDLDLGGTDDGSEQVEQSIESAQDVTVEVFEREDEQLEQVQEENEEHDQELTERTGTVESDLGKISDAGGRITTQETNSELIQAKEAAIRDIEFLQDHERRAREAGQESDRVQQEHRSRVNAARR